VGEKKNNKKQQTIAEGRKADRASKSISPRPSPLPPPPLNFPLI